MYWSDHIFDSPSVTPRSVASTKGWDRIMFNALNWLCKVPPHASLLVCLGLVYFLQQYISTYYSIRMKYLCIYRCYCLLMFNKSVFSFLCSRGISRSSLDHHPLPEEVDNDFLPHCLLHDLQEAVSTYNRYDLFSKNRPGDTKYTCREQQFCFHISRLDAWRQGDNKEGGSQLVT